MISIAEAAVIRACEEPTLLDALTWIAVWESERVVVQARRNEIDPATGKQWDTCFRYYFKRVMERYGAGRAE